MSKKAVFTVMFGFLIVAELQAMTLEGGYYKALDDAEDLAPNHPSIHFEQRVIVPKIRKSQNSERSVYAETASPNIQKEKKEKQIVIPSFQEMAVTYSRQIETQAQKGRFR